ncbi:MAG: integrase core domain-containing protein [Bacteroidales bacterium]
MRYGSYTHNQDARLRTIGEVREMTEEWMYYYNNERPHETLGNIPPMKHSTKKENAND